MPEFDRNSLLILGATTLLVLGATTLSALIAIRGHRLMPAELRRFFADARARRREIALRPSRHPLRLVLIRHGQSAANLKAANVVGGRDEGSPLSLLGEEQAAMLGSRFAAEGTRFDRVIASHAVRAACTAEIACAALEMPMKGIEIDKRAVEFSQGALELQPRAEVYKEGGPVLRGCQAEQMFYRPPGCSPDGVRGESQYDVELRFRSLVDDLLDEAADLARSSSGAAGDEPRTIGIFSHGIAIRSFLRYAIGADASFTVRSETANTSITELVYKPTPGNMGGWTLVRLNDATHLQ